MVLRLSRRLRRNTPEYIASRSVMALNALPAEIVFARETSERCLLRRRMEPKLRQKAVNKALYLFTCIDGRGGFGEARNRSQHLLVATTEMGTRMDVTRFDLLLFVSSFQ